MTRGTSNFKKDIIGFKFISRGGSSLTSEVQAGLGEQGRAKPQCPASASMEAPGPPERGAGGGPASHPFLGANRLGWGGAHTPGSAELRASQGDPVEGAPPPAARTRSLNPSEPGEGRISCEVDTAPQKTTSGAAGPREEGK